MNQLYALVLIGIFTVLTVALRWVRKRFGIGEPAYDELLEEAFWFLLTLLIALVPAALVASWPPTLLASVAVPFTMLRMRWYQKLHGEETAEDDKPRERSWREIIDAAVGRQQRRTELGVVRQHAREAVDHALDEALFAPLSAHAEELSEQEARERVESALDEATRRLRAELTEVLPKVWARPWEVIERVPIATDEVVEAPGTPPFDRELVIEEYERYLLQREASTTLRIRGKNLALSGESMLIASGREARLISYPGLAEQHRFAVGERRRAQSTALSPRANLFAVGLRDHVQLHAPDGPLPDGRLVHRGNVRAVVFSPDGEFLAASSTEGLVRVWNVADKSLRYEFTREQSFPAVCFSGDGRLLAAAATDGRVYLLDAATGDLRRVFVHAPGATSAMLFAVALSPDGRLLLSGGIDGEAKLWDIEDRRCLGTSWTLGNLRPATTRKAVWAVAFSPDGSLFAIAKWGAVTVWSTGAQKHVLTIFLDKDPLPQGIAFTPLGDAIAVQTGKAVRIYGIPAGVPARLVMLTADGFAAEPPELVQAQSLLAAGNFDAALELCVRWRHAQGAPVSGIDSIDEDLANLSCLDARLPADDAHRWELIAHAVRHGVSDGALCSLLARMRKTVATKSCVRHNSGCLEGPAG